MSTLKYRDSNNDYQGFYVKVTDTLPVGSVYLWGGITAPSGYLICDGRAVSRTEYADLFKAIGTNFGSGDGLTTFNIPDYRGRVPVGLDGSDVDFDTIGKTGGEKKHTMTIEELVPHRVHLPMITVNNYRSEEFYSNERHMLVQHDDFDRYSDYVGGGQPFNVVQPSLVTNYIIKASNKVALERGNVVDSLTGEDTDSAPSVRAVKEALVESYSTSEVKTNKVWIDGKPIYRKVIKITTTGVFSTGITDIDEVTDVYGMFYISGVNGYGWQPIPRVTVNVSEFGAGIGNLRLQDDILTANFYLGSNYSTLEYANITFEYTKTTD